MAPHGHELKHEPIGEVCFARTAGDARICTDGASTAHARQQHHGVGQLAPLHLGPGPHQARRTVVDRSTSHRWRRSVEDRGPAVPPPAPNHHGLVTSVLGVRAQPPRVEGLRDWPPSPWPARTGRDRAGRRLMRRSPSIAGRALDLGRGHRIWTQGTRIWRDQLAPGIPCRRTP